MVRIISCLMLLLLVSLGHSQETGTIKGHITDSEMMDEPLLFAHVSLSDTDRSVQTNFHGNFEFEGIEPGEYILTVDYLGYESQTVHVSVQSNEVSYISQGLAAKNTEHPQFGIAETAAISGSDK